MGEAWYEGLPDDAFMTETDKAYEAATAVVRENLAKGLDFAAACEGIHVDNGQLREQIIDDLLKVLIAEEHFEKGLPLDKVSEKLRVPVEKLQSAKHGMIDDVKNASIKAFYRGLGRKE